MQEQGLHLRDYLWVLWKRRYTLLVTFVLIVAAALFRSYSTTPIYQASAKLLVEKIDPQSMLITNPYYYINDPEFYQTQVQLIKSAAVAEKVAEILPEQAIAALSGGETRDTETLARVISAGVSAAPVKDSKIIAISYTSSNPELAAHIVNSVSQAYIEEVLEIKVSSSRYAIQWMTEKAAEERAKLEESERNLQEYRKQRDIVTVENRVAIIPDRLSELSLQLSKAETKRRDLETLYQKAAALSADPDQAESLPVVASDSTLKSLRTEIIRAEQRIEELSRKLGDRHPDMQAAQGDIKLLQQKRIAEISRIVESIRNEYELARDNEEALRQRLAATKDEAQALNESSTEYDILKRSVDTNRDFYNALISKIKEHSITEQTQRVSVWVLERAETPRSPIRPNRLNDVMLGFLLGLFGAVGMVFFAEYFDNTIKTPEEAEARTGLPALGVIELQKARDRGVEEALLSDSTSSLAEGYRALRTSILLSSPDSPFKSLLVTSMGAEEGKTATAVNLAVATAQSGYSVLLVDGDVRKPNIHKILGLDNTKGLTCYLAGLCGEEEIILPGPTENLDVIPAGPTTPNPSELLGSKRLSSLLEKGGTRYDVVIFDSSPLLAVADALLLSRRLDRTILVTRAGKTTYDSVRRGLKSLNGVNSRILGMVLNGLDARKSGYRYFNYYDSYAPGNSPPRV